MNFLPFEEARRIARSLPHRTSREWLRASYDDQLPRGLPSSPHTVYRGLGWISWHDFLDKDSKSRFLPFSQALEAARESDCETQRQWFRAAAENKLPKGLPYHPHVVYRNSGWISWMHWLGKEKARRSRFLPFDEARKLAVRLGCRSRAAWDEAVRNGRLPKGVPAAPYVVYRKSGWFTWEHWVGKIERPG